MTCPENSCNLCVIYTTRCGYTCQGTSYNQLVASTLHILRTFSKHCATLKNEHLRPKEVGALPIDITYQGVHNTVWSIYACGCTTKTLMAGHFPCYKTASKGVNMFTYARGHTISSPPRSLQTHRMDTLSLSHQK